MPPSVFVIECSAGQVLVRVESPAPVPVPENFAPVAESIICLCIFCLNFQRKRLRPIFVMITLLLHMSSDAGQRP